MKQRISNGLVTLSSAAILSVYGAGYARTREASDRFDAEDQRRPKAPIPAVTPEGAESQMAAAPPSTAEAPTFALPTRPASELQRPSPATAPVSSSEVAVSPVAAANAAATASNTIAPSDRRSAGAPNAAMAIATAAAASVAETASQPASPAQPTATAVAAEAAPAAASVLKDGTYLGWGHCRHGDIQAAVTVEAGKISEARIATCLTRYSCSWIAPLPPQVVQRQSAETDYVSGATDSTNAFYYAVIDALSKAK